ncbi:uncharacterized protein LOC8069252 isoform X3 [Sorghum bicolor]|uniref:uncharacterized protein LOC8069252 isoform X3 n=1 Tax=Sorghum bicolor TaxID=4558 RepID=UPI000B42397A|nr:uncharacterized protein LOC8069252 isoform X3 [Sorghum bicolor]|eukprot:XP_021304842.1 uncharacterized protein LOC8069252 isoform X3 [Sorghum bicolor]
MSTSRRASPGSCPLRPSSGPATPSGSSSRPSTASTPAATAPTAPPLPGTGRPRARTASSARAEQGPSSASRRRSSSTEAGRPEATAPLGSCTSTARPSPSSSKAKTFVLYRLFNKNEGESEASDAADSPSTSSPAIAPAVKAENLSQPASAKMSHLLATVSSNEPTSNQGDDHLLDVLSQLPDLQREHKFDGFPTITSPMRPYTDHPFLGNAGEQDLSVYIDSIIAHQDLEDLLASPCLADMVEQATVNVEPHPTSLPILDNSSNSKRLAENSRGKVGSETLLLIKGTDDTGAAASCSATKILQADKDNINHHTGAQSNLASNASAQVSHFYNQYQLQSAFIPETEPPNSGALCSAASLTPYPQHLFNGMVAPARIDISDSDVFNGLQGWAAEPSKDPHQGNAPRRIRLVHSIQRASVIEPVLTSHLEGEDEAGLCYSTDSSSTNNNEDYANVFSQSMAGEAMHIQGGGVIPTQVVSSTEITEKLQDFTLDEGTLLHGELHHGGNLKQRHKQEHTEETSQDVREGMQQSVHVTGVAVPSLRRQRESARIGSVVRLLFLALVVILVFVGLWKCSSYKLFH